MPVPLPPPPVFAGDGEGAWVLSISILSISSKSERAKGTIHPHLSSDTCPWMPSESPYRIAAKWALGTQLARPRQCPQLLALRAGSLTARPGLGPRAEGFCSQLAARRSPLSLARLQSPRPRDRITAGCSRGRSPSCHRSHRQGLSMGPAHIQDAPYPREGECDKVSLK